MNERFIEWLLTEKLFGRRKIVSTPAKVAAAYGIGYGVSEASKIIIPTGEKFGDFEDIDKKTKGRLLQFSPITIAHTGGNSANHLEMSKLAGVDFVEADIRLYRGKLSVTHGDNLPPPVIDYGIRFLGLGKSVPLVAEIIEHSANNHQRLFLDLKEESPNSTDHVVKTVNKFGLSERTAYTGKWAALDRISHKTKKNGSLFYSIDNEEQLFSFMDEQTARQAQGVSLNFTLAREDVVKDLRTHGVINVFVYGADYSYEIISALEADADAIITGNLGALELWKKPSRDYFFA